MKFDSQEQLCQLMGVSSYMNHGTDIANYDKFKEFEELIVTNKKRM